MIQISKFHFSFSGDPDYVFVSQQYLEKLKVEKQIDVAMSKGKLSGNGKEFMTTLEADLMNIFREILNTPSYWRKMRNEIFARMEQLGPFHFFFTLSCAEHKWDEVKASLLQLEGKNVTFEFDEGNEQPRILVEGLPLEVFAADNPQLIKDLYKTKFIHVTRLLMTGLRLSKRSI